MTPMTILKPELAERFHLALTRCRILFFSAPCGFGKSTVASTLLEGRRVYALSAGEPGAALPPPDGTWDTLVVDNLQYWPDEDQTLCALIRNEPERRFVLLSRGVPPGWLMPFQLSGLTAVFDAQALCFDRQTTGRLLEAWGVSVSDLELTAIQEETSGYPLAVSLLGQHMASGLPYAPSTTDRVRREIFLYFEEAVYRRFDRSVRRLLLELAPFEHFGVELARMVSGNNRAGELLGGLQKRTTMLLQDRLNCFHFHPIFRKFLQWELDQEYPADQQKVLYSRGGLYYELREDYGSALACYSKAGDHGKVSELLEKNAQLHPGLGHYEEMEPYYHSLPEAEIRNSPALMQGMSMLCALEMDYEGSEQWYQALKDFAAARKRGDAVRREAHGRLAWLDIALPQRGVAGLTESIPAVFRLLTAREIELPPFSVTSTLPSLMNGGKDFSDWSKIDDLLYKTLRKPVEAILGRDGVGLADLAIAESKFEKGEDISARILTLIGRLNTIRQQGTPDLEFALVGLLARSQMAAGRAKDARETLTDLRRQFEERNLRRFLPNLDAMLCRVDLRLGDMTAVDRWYREKAPRDRIRVHVLRRYQYHTQAMAELALGDPEAALLTLAPLVPYYQDCRRHLDGLESHIMTAIALERLRKPLWQENLRAALDTALEYRFLRPVAAFGGAVLPLLDKCGWAGDPAFQDTLTVRTREQAACYPDFLRPRKEMAAPLSTAEQQVLRLICADKSNAEIGEILHIQLATVKTHVSHILTKLGVKRRSEAKTAAERLHLL